MKKILRSFIFVSVCAAAIIFGSTAFAEPFYSQTIGGATGLISTPTADVAWKEGTNIGLDFGMHYLRDDKWALNPKVTASFAGKFEVGAMFDWQERPWPRDEKENDLLFHGKWKFYRGSNFDLAFGGNFQFIDLRNSDTDGEVIQLYVAGTYSTMLFCCIPADFTFTIGKSFNPWGVRLKTRTSNREFRFIAKLVDEDGYTRAGDIDFGFGVDIDLWPTVLGGYVHWISDFANYSYTADPMGVDPNYSACFNTGLRIQPLRGRSNFKWNIDLLITDFMDHTRDWGIGTTFGFAL